MMAGAIKQWQQCMICLFDLEDVQLWPQFKELFLFVHQ
jgi:hypothetical protein